MRAKTGNTSLRIAQKVCRTRQFRDIDEELAAQYLNLTLDEYKQYEAGQRLFPDKYVCMLSILLKVKPSFLTGTTEACTSSNIVDFQTHLRKQRNRQVYMRTLTNPEPNRGTAAR